MDKGILLETKTLVKYMSRKIHVTPTVNFEPSKFEPVTSLISVSACEVLLFD